MAKLSMHTVGIEVGQAFSAVREWYVLLFWRGMSSRTETPFSSYAAACKAAGEARAMGFGAEVVS